MRLIVLLLAVTSLRALAAEELPPPPPPPPPPSSDAPTADAPPPPSAEPAPAVEAKGRTNWAKPAAFIGFGVGGGALALSIIAFVIGLGECFDNYCFGAGGALMFIPLALTAAGGPVVYAGGSSARWTKSITGSRGLRITGWILYGVALAAELISIGYVTTRIPAGLLAAGSMACFGLDALFSAGEAADVAEMAEADEGVRFAPTVSVLPGFGGRGSGATLGIAGVF